MMSIISAPSSEDGEESINPQVSWASSEAVNSSVTPTQQKVKAPPKGQSKVRKSAAGIGPQKHVSVGFKDLTFAASGRVIVDRVAGFVAPREVLCILGPR
jgi:hypothetical protein